MTKDMEWKLNRYNVGSVGMWFGEVGRVEVLKGLRGIGSLWEGKYVE